MSVLVVQVKNTFIDVVRDGDCRPAGARPRARSSPPGPRRQWCTGEKPDLELEEAETSASSASGEASPEQGFEVAETSASSASGEAPPDLRFGEPEQEPGDRTSGACFFDRKWFTGRDMRKSRPVQLGECGGQPLGEFIVSIYPSAASATGRGANFQRANGVCRIQVKCNRPMDADLCVSVDIGNGAPPRRVEHNFAHKPLMRVPGEWDFKAALGKGARFAEAKVTVAVEPATLAPGAAPAPSVAADAAAADAPAAVARPSSAIAPRGLPPLQLRAPEWTPTATPEGTPRLPFASLSPEPSVGRGSAGVRFSFAVRRADGVKLGLELSRGEDDLSLLVVSVRPEGAIDAWNRLCAAGPSSGKVVARGDEILSVNGRSGCAGMLEEIRERQLLKLSVLRGVPGSQAPSAWPACEQDIFDGSMLASHGKWAATPLADSVVWADLPAFFLSEDPLGAWLGA